VKKYSGKFFSPPKLFLSPTAAEQLTSLLAQKEDSACWRGHSNEEYCLAKNITKLWRHCVWFGSGATANTMKWIFILLSAESLGPEDKATRKTYSDYWRLASMSDNKWDWYEVGFVSGSFSSHEGRSPRRRCIFRHWGPERYDSKHTFKKVKWFS